MFAALLENRPSALQRLSGLFGRHGHNIDSLTVSPTGDEGISRVTWTADVGDKADSLVRQLRTLHGVVAVQILEPERSQARELWMVKVRSGRLEDVLRRLGATRLSTGPVDIWTVVVESGQKRAVREELATPDVVEWTSTGVVALSTEEEGLKPERIEMQRGGAWS